MIKEKNTKNKNSSYRFFLEKENNEKISLWMQEIKKESPGVRVNKSELLNWLIKALPDKPPKKDINAIKKEFFNELFYAQWALSEIRKSKKEGRSLKLSELISTASTRAPRKTKIQKEELSSNNKASLKA